MGKEKVQKLKKKQLIGFMSSTLKIKKILKTMKFLAESEPILLNFGQGEQS